MPGARLFGPAPAGMAPLPAAEALSRLGAAMQSLNVGVSMRSAMQGLKAHKASARGLGLRRMHHTVEVEDTPCTRGMVNKVSYMLRVEEIDNAA